MKRWVFTMLFLVFAVTHGGNLFAAGYCEGHAKKQIILRNASEFTDAVQREINRYNMPENDFNGRYEICFDVRDLRNSEIIGELGLNQKLSLNNNSNREVVIGFLKARRSDDSTTPILEIRGRNVTVFAPEMSHVKQAIKLIGNGHKIVGGTINGIANSGDSLCVSGNGNNIEIQDLEIKNCANGIRLSGDQSRIQNTSVLMTDAAHLPILQGANEPDVDFWIRFDQNRVGHVSGTCISVSGSNASLENLRVDECDGVSVKLLGSGHRIVNSRFAGEPIPDDLKDLVNPSGLARHSTDCLLIRKSSNVTLENNDISRCHEGIHIQESQQIYIGPEQLADFESKHNSLHHNTYAIHAQNSQQVFVWHNKIYGNGRKSADDDNEKHKFGLWLESTNYLEAVLLQSPMFESLDGPRINDFEEDEEVPVIRYPPGVLEIPMGQSVEGQIEIAVPMGTGFVELVISNKRDSMERYQSKTSLKDCTVSNIATSTDGQRKIQCTLPIDENLVGKRILAILHESSAGSSPLTKTLGILNGPLGVPVSMPAPTTGGMAEGAMEGGGNMGPIASGAPDNPRNAGQSGEEEATQSGSGKQSSDETKVVSMGGGSGGVSGGVAGIGGCHIISAASQNKPQNFSTVNINLLYLLLIIALWSRRLHAEKFGQK